jgi:glycerol-3-phosphate dehydrogenase
MPSRQYDVIVIGAGVVGSLVARALSRYELDILLIEKASDIGTGASSGHASIVHAGYDPVPGSLKAALNVAGNRLWPGLAAELDFAYDRGGDYVVAVSEDELRKLDTLLERGRRNGVTDMAIISGEELRRREPRITPQVRGALYAATGGVCAPFAVTVAAAENAVMNGVTLLLDTAFEDFVQQDDRIVAVRTNRGTFGCRWAVNAAGLYADEVMHRAGVRPEFTITPRRGEYVVLDRADFRIGTTLFPVPSPISKGIVVTKTTHGNAVLGPTAHEVADKRDTAVTRAGLEEVWHGASKLVPGVDPRHAIATFAGLRAAGNARCQTPGVDYNHDFIIETPAEVRGFVNLGGIESPGLTSAPAIAERVVALLRDAGEPLPERRDWNPIRPARPRFRDLSSREQARLVEQDPRYGRIVCRCETVMEGEIVAEMHTPIPARTYDALKRRTWLGTGRCQGGFDTPRVAEILARELGTSRLQVTKKGTGSELLARPTKQVEG